MIRRAGVGLSGRAGAVGGTGRAAAVHGGRVRAGPTGRAAVLPLVAAALLLAGGSPSGPPPLHAQASEAEGAVAAAEAALRTGRYEEAIAAYGDLARRGSAYPAADRGLVRALAEVGRYEAAVRAARASVEKRPDSPEMRRALGDALALRGELAEAEAAFREAIRGRVSDRLRAEVGLGLLLERRGEREEAMAAFGRVAAAWDADAGLEADARTAAGVALARLGLRDPARYRDAVRAFQEATDADPGDPEPRVRLGDLFLDKYNSRDAGASFQDVLKANPRHPGALLGMARRARFDGSPEAPELARWALETNPSLVPARVLLARLHLDVEEPEAAEEEARRALEADPRSLEALAALAAARYLGDDTAGFEEARDRALALNPRYAGVHLTAGELAVRYRRYADAVALARRALEIDPESHDARALLGLNLLRTGEVEEARAALEAAFDADPYNVWVKNTLDLLDTFDRFREVRSPRFAFLVREEEAALLGPYLTAVAESAYDALAARYGYRPPTPIRVELYDRHADFSVRTVGLAGLGALGVSFGSVLAMDSPSAREPGAFNWASTLWHEISHAFTLGLTEHRVPRWLSEGLAVHDEGRARPAWGADADPAFLAAFRDGRLEPVGGLNRGFVRPSYPGHVQHSYLQASLLCRMIEEEGGADALLALLEAYREGEGTEGAFRRALGTDPEALDERFRGWMERRFAGPLAGLEEFGTALARGTSLYEAGRSGEARPHLERARDLFPEYTGPQSPRGLLAAIHAAAGRPREAAAELAALTAVDETAYRANLELADLLEAAGDARGAAAALERAVQVYPLEPEPHRRLAEVYEAAGDAEGAVRERGAVLALEPVDRAEALYRLAVAHERAGDREAARRAVLRALEVAPGYEEAQELLLRLRGATGTTERREP